MPFKFGLFFKISFTSDADSTKDGSFQAETLAAAAEQQPQPEVSSSSSVAQDSSLTIGDVLEKHLHINNFGNKIRVCLKMSDFFLFKIEFFL